MKQITVPIMAVAFLSVGLSALLILELLNYFVPEVKNTRAVNLTPIEFSTEPGAHLPDPPTQTSFLGNKSTFVSAGTISSMSPLALKIKGLE